MIPCGWIQPNINANASNMNNATERAIRIVRNFTVRLVLPPSLIMLNKLAPRLIRMSARSSNTMILTIIGKLDQSWLRGSGSLLDRGRTAV